MRAHPFRLDFWLRSAQINKLKIETIGDPTMKSRLSATVAAIGLAAVAFASPTHAAFVSTDNTFFNAPTAGTLTFTYEGFSAGDTNIMRVAINGTTIFQNDMTPV